MISFFCSRYNHILFWVFLTYILVLVTANMAGKQENHKLLKSLGLSKVRMPSSHYRKRLAVDARHYSRSDDSHMFVIKLPPNPHYYVNNYPINNPEMTDKKKIPVGFKSNGKPKRIYHWNIPVLKKMAHHRSNQADNRLLKDDHRAWNNEKHSQSTVYHRKIPTYYVPVKQKKTSFHKYFPGNGKPQSFYVIEKSKKSHFHKLLV